MEISENPSSQSSAITALEQRCEVIENLELDSPTGQLSADLYCELLAIHILQNDLCNAKYLWKRIPKSEKSKSMELPAVWEVGKALWKHNYSEAQTLSTAYNWSDNVHKLMDAFREALRMRCLKLITQGYSSIKKQHLSSMLGLSEDETSDLIQRQGWSTQPDSEFVKPFSGKKLEDSAINNKEYLEKLTQYILFLET